MTDLSKTPASLLTPVAGLLLLCAVLASCAQWNPPAQNRQPSPESPSESAPATPSGTSPQQAAPDQKDAGWSAVRGRYWCGPPIPERESFFDKMTRLLFSRDWCGPDPDVDTNIQAGGAAGG